MSIHGSPGRQPRNPALPDHLPCGTELDDLIEQVAAGHNHDLSPHQQACTHSRAALADIDQLWPPVAALAADRLHPPADLLETVMSQVRELAREIWHIVTPDHRCGTRIAARVIGGIASRAAARAQGVRVVLGRSSQANLVADTAEATQRHRQPGSAVGIAGQHAVIDLAVVTDYGLRIPDIADEIRRLVMRDLSELAGLDDARIDIYVDDVTDPPARAPDHT
jgi:uncharacterized alkaline shock family protein YloU